MRAISFLPLLLVAVAMGQDRETYLAKRKEHGVDRPMPVNRWSGLPDGKIAELRGVVQMVRSGETATWLVERPGADPLPVEAIGASDDAVGKTMRLLVATQVLADGTRTYRLLAFAEDEAIVPFDPQAPAVRTIPTRKVTDAPAKTAGLTGAITPRGTRATRSRTSARSRPVSSRRAVAPATHVARTYAAFVKRMNPRLTDLEASRIARSVLGFSLRDGVDARLIVAMVIVESRFRPDAVSRAGARGLGQLMPGTARMLGVRNPHDPVDNVYGMVRLMRNHLTTYTRQTGSAERALPLALAAYNAGPGAVKRFGGIPPYRETQDYVVKVIGYYRQLAGR